MFVAHNPEHTALVQRLETEKIELEATIAKYRQLVRYFNGELIHLESLSYDRVGRRQERRMRIPSELHHLMKDVL